MKLIKTMEIAEAIIDVYQDEEGNIILGGFNWYEYNDYEKNKQTFNGQLKDEATKLHKVPE